MGTVFDAVKKFFNDDEWYFMEVDNRAMLQMGFQGKNGKWTCYAQTNEEQFLFFFYSVCPINVPAEKRLAASEFISRANYGMKVGNFEMDFNDGEIRFKTSIDVENTELTPPLISNQVYANVWTLDRYLPGIFSVVYGDKEPKDAIEEVEK